MQLREDHSLRRLTFGQNLVGKLETLVPARFLGLPRCFLVGPFWKRSDTDLDEAWSGGRGRRRWLKSRKLHFLDSTRSSEAMEKDLKNGSPFQLLTEDERSRKKLLRLLSHDGIKSFPSSFESEPAMLMTVQNGRQLPSLTFLPPLEPNKRSSATFPPIPRYSSPLNLLQLYPPTNELIKQACFESRISFIRHVESLPPSLSLPPSPSLPSSSLFSTKPKRKASKSQII